MSTSMNVKKFSAKCDRAEEKAAREEKEKEWKKENVAGVERKFRILRPLSYLTQRAEQSKQ